MTTTTVVVGLILIFLLFTQIGRALALLGVVILGLWLGPTIWSNLNPPPQPVADRFGCTGTPERRLNELAGQDSTAAELAACPPIGSIDHTARTLGR
jgi:hypothetical protein